MSHETPTPEHEIIKPFVETERQNDDTELDARVRTPEEMQELRRQAGIVVEKVVQPPVMSAMQPEKSTSVSHLDRAAPEFTPAPEEDKPLIIGSEEHKQLLREANRHHIANRLGGGE